MAVEVEDAMLRLEGLTRRFGGISAVDGVSFSVAAGSITGVIGPNGAGKTTLFNCIAGLFPPNSGTINLQGQPIQGLRPDAIFRRGLARTFQIPRPFPQMTLLDNVMVAPRGQSGERFWAAWLTPAAVAAEERSNLAKAMHWLDFVGLADLANQPASILSGGQRKLLELARVMVAEPALVLLDEPGAGVNPKLLDMIVDKIAALNRSGVTFLLIEHNMDLVAALCQPVIVMAEGRVLTSGSAADVTRDPRVIEAYLGGVLA
jgi:branched-chain amino acid transport system ATP-binding protein